MMMSRAAAVSKRIKSTFEQGSGGRSPSEARRPSEVDMPSQRHNGRFPLSALVSTGTGTAMQTVSVLRQDVRDDD
jgi:hypothetical protein